MNFNSPEFGHFVKVKLVDIIKGKFADREFTDVFISVAVMVAMYQH